MTSKRGTRLVGRRAAVGTFGSGIAVVLLASAAFACTMIMGNTKIANPSNATWIQIEPDGDRFGPGVTAARGATVKVTAFTLPPKSKYVLWFVWPASVTNGVGCHEVDTTTGMVMKTPAGVKLNEANPMKANSSGALDSNATLAGNQPYKAKIPTDARAVSGGTAQICGREIPPWRSSTGWEAATQHINLTIL